ncbi:Crp/Fnr family transcriptional regulator [Svornostia abyssi]|uniref:Crp/Fnr family transcriptional regulator n=1 Tax=Svornostia abyssi TaxID=2898438 RepID=A0ABY5PNA1_9ACTN|nr:Crp/Fnr family transcriptional regulator [Parviterribacteraceae bacterium J379]
MEWQILEGVPEEDVQRVLDMARRRTFRKGEIVFHEGDPGDTLHLVRSGRFAVKVSTQYADEAILAVLRAGDIFGELALLSPGAPRSATVVALEAGETMSVHQLDFGRLRREQPGVGDVLISVLSAQVRRLSRHLLEALYTPADTRVRRRVLELVDIYTGDDPSLPVTIPLTQDDLADLAGTSRATVNRVLREDEARGIVELGRGRTLVIDREGLTKWAGL